MNTASLSNTSQIPKIIVNELYLCVLHPNLIEYTAATKSQNADTKCVYYNNIGGYTVIVHQWDLW